MIFEPLLFITSNMTEEKSNDADALKNVVTITSTRWSARSSLAGAGTFLFVSKSKEPSVNDHIVILSHRTKSKAAWQLIGGVPHRNRETVSREDRLRKACAHRTKTCGIRIGERVKQSSSRDAVGAEPVEDGSWKTGTSGKGWIGVQWVSIARESIQKRLISASVVRHDHVG